MTTKRATHPTRNPFPYAQVVTGPDFADRKGEIAQLRVDLTTGEKVLISSPRRYGKTSLVFEVARRLKSQKLTFIYLDLMRATSLSRLIEIYATAQAQATETKLDNVVKLVRDLLPGLRPELTVKPDGAPEISLKFPRFEKDAWNAFASVVDNAERIAEKKDTPVAVVFDEFQEISNIEKGVVEELRARLQFHKRCAYVFMGSKRHVLTGMFEDRTAPLFKLAKPLVLTRIDPGEFTSFIAQKFAQANIDVTEDSVAEIVDLTCGHPYYTQLLCHELYNIALDGRALDSGALHEAVGAAVRSQSYAYMALWDSLSAKQKNLVVGLAIEGGRAAVYSGAFVNAHGLTSAATAQRAAAALEVKGVLDREPAGYALSDVFFTKWLEAEIL